jgi:hypothetical protein
VEKTTMRMMYFWRGDWVAEAAGIEGEEQGAIGPGEAVVGELSLFFIYFLFNKHTDLVHRKTSVQRAQEDIAADSAGPPAKLFK